MKPTCHIIGMLDNGLPSLNEAATSTLFAADLLVGGARLLKLVSPSLKTTTATFDLTSKLKEVAPLVEQALADNKKVAVLASGDPLFYGIGNYLIKKLGAEQIEIFPQVTSVQLAASRLGIPPQDLKICSIHTADMGDWEPNNPGIHGLADLLAQIQQHDNLAILTSPSNSPKRLAKMLIAEGLEDCFRWSVCESLAGESEKIHRDLSADQVQDKDFSEPNLLVLQRQSQRKFSARLGTEDSEYHQRKPDKGLITKREVRLVSLGLLGIRPTDILWDIGAGSGAVGIEASSLCPFGHVFGIEKNDADFEIALQNKAHFGAYNLHLTQGKAPEGLEDWPRPNGVFLGGTGGNLTALLDLCWAQLLPGGTLVFNLISLENQATALDWFKQNEIDWQMTQLQVANCAPILDMHRLKGTNPVSIFFATKQSDE